MKKLLISFALIVVLSVSAVLTACGPKALAITPGTVTMEQYEEQTLSVNKEGTVVWTSSDPATVRVEGGKITSVKMGSATVTAVLGEESAVCEVTVVKATKNRSLIIDTDKAELFIGVEGKTSKQVTAELKEAGATIRGIDYTWASGDPSVATVADGLITAVESGQTTVTVSAKYNAQAFAKEILVTVRDWSHKDSQMKLMSSDSTSVISAYTGDVTALGFAAETAVTQLTVNDAEHFAENKVIADGAVDGSGNHAYDRMIFDMSLEEVLIGDLVFWMNDKEYTFTNGSVPALGLDFNVIVFDRETGEVHRGVLEAKHVYTFVVTLNQTSAATEKAWGMAIKQNTSVYFANVVCCNGDYYQDRYEELNKPDEPFSDVYFVYGDNLEKLTDIDSDGWYEQTFAEGDLWGKRVFLGNAAWSVIYNYTDMKERFDYFGFNIVFKNTVAGAIWTGGYAIMLAADGSLTKEGGGAIEPGDIYIYDGNGNYMTGKPLALNQTYSIKIRIQKETDGVYQNLTTGFGLSGAGTILVKDPYFIKQDTPDPIPNPEQKLHLPQMVCGDAQTELAKSVETGYTDWYTQTFTDNLWAGRVYGFGQDITFVGMREYDYFGFDIVFKDNFAAALIWSGSGTITVANNKFNAAAGDLFVYDAEGNDVTDQELQLGVKYTLRIKLYGADGNDIGLGLTSAGTILVANPFLLKVE